MSVEDNKEIVRRYVESLGDPTGVGSAELLDDGVVISIMTRTGVGGAVPAAMTKDEYLRFRVEQRPAFLPLGVRHEIRSMIGEGDVVAAETECFADLPDGRVYNNLFHFVFELRDGRIVASREYTDFLYAKVTLFGGAG